MDYLEHILGIHVTLEKTEIRHLPNFITGKYRIQKAKLSGKEVLFLYPLTELESVEAYDLSECLAFNDKSGGENALLNINLCSTCSKSA